MPTGSPPDDARGHVCYAVLVQNKCFGQREPPASLERSADHGGRGRGGRTRQAIENQNI